MVKQKFLTAAFFSALLLSALAGTSLVNLAEANPSVPPLIVVNSPQNNKIYYSTEVQLNFKQIPDTDIIFTSFDYSLDGKARVATNGSTVLTGLSYGSHTLTIYDNGTYYGARNQTYINEFTLEVISFNIVFSTSWVVLSIVLVALICLAILVRKRLVRAFKGKKTSGFWFGLVWFLFFTALTSFPISWFINNYLSPHYPPDAFAFAGSFYGVIFGIGFMLIGLYLMKKGIIKESQIPQTASS